MTLLRIDCDASWSTVTWDPTRPPCISGAVVEPIPLTPRALLWTPDMCGAPNALASALLTFLQLPVQHLRGPAHLTGLAADPEQPGPLTPTQVRAFTSTLQALHAMPDFLALHAQAGRIAATWFCPTATRSFP
jgi:hypothetical protein